MNAVHTRRMEMAFAVAALVALVAAPAEARFGKRSQPREEHAQDRGDKRGEKKERASSSTHAASPVSSVQSSDVPAPSGVVVVESSPVYVESHGHLYAHGPYVDTYVAPPPSVEADPFRVRRFELFGTAQPLVNGGVMGVGLRVDWSRFGLDARYDHLALLAEDGSLTFDRIQLLDATMSWALLDGENGRLRAHAGVYTAVAPDILFVGPGAGASLSLDLIGPFTADAGAHLVLIPFTKLDSHAALGLRVGALEGRLGFRFTVLDDQGRVDGVRNTDVLAGPYLGVSLVL